MFAGQPFPFFLLGPGSFPFSLLGPGSFSFSLSPPPNLLSSFSWAYRVFCGLDIVRFFLSGCFGHYVKFSLEFIVNGCWRWCFIVTLPGRPEMCTALDCSYFRGPCLETKLQNSRFQNRCFCISCSFSLNKFVWNVVLHTLCILMSGCFRCLRNASLTANQETRR